jgi:type I restriction enzyme M protein
MALENQLWNIANILRGKMGADEFRDYILGFIFFRYLSEKIKLYADDTLKKYGLTLTYEDFLIPEKINSVDPQKYLGHIKNKSLKALGYFILPQHLFSSFINQAKINRTNGRYGFIIGDLEVALKAIEKEPSTDKFTNEFKDLFEDLQLQSTRLGKNPNEINEVIVNIMLSLEGIDFKLDDAESDVLGDAYEYLISQFASSAGKKAGEFYTPQEVSKVLAKIISIGKTQIKGVYDPTCGSGSLLLRVAKELNNKVSLFYGQELNRTTFNLARMNMIIHGVRHNRMNLQQDDTLKNPMHIDLRFEGIVANPPFSAHWDSSNVKHLERFTPYGKLAPATKADFAFVQHMLYHLDEQNGVMATVLPHGVLFRGSSEENIRKYIIEKNWLDAIIGLPANIFYGTSIPTCIIVCKKNRLENDPVLFVDASQDYEKAKTQNNLRDQDIDKIVDAYQHRKNVDKYCRLVYKNEIVANDFNLNIPRYIDNLEVEEDLDLDAIGEELMALDKAMLGKDDEIAKFCLRLGIKKPF